jgi:hypothetical protein
MNKHNLAQDLRGIADVAQRPPRPKAKQSKAKAKAKGDAANIPSSTYQTQRRQTDRARRPTKARWVEGFSCLFRGVPSLRVARPLERWKRSRDHRNPGGRKAAGRPTLRLVAARPAARRHPSVSLPGKAISETGPQQNDGSQKTTLPYIYTTEAPAVQC